MRTAKEEDTFLIATGTTRQRYNGSGWSRIAGEGLEQVEL